jgi:hypothetical protein
MAMARWLGFAQLSQAGRGGETVGIARINQFSRKGFVRSNNAIDFLWYGYNTVCRRPKKQKKDGILEK